MARPGLQRFVYPPTDDSGRATISAGGFQRWLLVVLVGCVVGLTAGLWANQPAPALPAVNADWRRLVSPHFELYSRIPDKESRALLYNLEILRAVFFERLHLEERLQLPVTIYAFGNEKEFRAYSPLAMRRADVAGFYLPQPDRAVISMLANGDVELAQQTIFHEYVHHLFRATERDPPLWFNEGTADVLAGMEVERDRVLIGMPLVGRALYLREEGLLPLDQLFKADHSSALYNDDKHTGTFYAESWALLHYLNFGNSGILKDAIDRFLRVAGDRTSAAQTDLRRHFQSCLGCDYEEMLRQLKVYIRTGTYRAGSQPLPKIPAVSTYAVQSVPLDEITVRLAELAVRVERSAVGKLVLLEAPTQRRNDPRPLEALGSLAIANGDEREAAERWEQAIAMGSNNAAVLRELALREGRQWFTEFDESFRLQTEVAVRLRSRLARSIEREPSQAAAYEMLAWVEAFAERPAPENINKIISHLPAMPEKQHTLAALVTVMLRVGKPNDAAVLLQYLGSLRLSPFDARAAAVAQARLATEFPSAAAAANSNQSPAVEITPPPAAPGLKTPSVALPDDL